MSSLLSSMFFIGMILLSSSCVKFEPDVGDKSSSATTTKSNFDQPKKKIFKAPTRIVHDFTARTPVEVSQDLINDPNVTHVIIENENGSFKMIIDKEDLQQQTSFNVPVSRLGEEIIPKPIYK